MKDDLVKGFGGGCGICGYSRCAAALDFHHIDPKGKDFAFGRYQSKAWKWIVAEIKKCAMLCANCHREVHNGVTEIPKSIRRFNEKECDRNARVA